LLVFVDVFSVSHYYTSIIALLFLTILEKTRLNVKRKIREVATRG